MGNHLCYAKPSKTRADAKVIRCDDGGIEEFRESIKVGELMVDNPHQFVCDFSGLQAGCRITALRAEEDLVLGWRLFASTYAKIFALCALARESSLATVAGRLVVPKLELDEDENRSTGLGFGLSQHRIPGFRYWKPALETIKESPRVRKTV